MNDKQQVRKYNMKKNNLTFLLLISLFITQGIKGQNTWTQKADIATGGYGIQNATAFSIGDKGYVVTGNITGVTLTKILWEYDVTTDTWTQKADFGGTARDFACAFSIGNKAYVGLGRDGNGYTKDFWEYNQSTNTWTKKADFGGTARTFAVAFSIGGKGYVGTGSDSLGNTKDFWEYNPITNTWAQKADFGGGNRTTATGFSIGNKGYLGTGSGATTQKDFWEYSPSTNSWTQKADWGNEPLVSAVGFSIGNKGYIGSGNHIFTNGNSFWEYDPTANTWTKKADFAGIKRSMAVAFTICSKGYIATGAINVGQPYYAKDLWEYTPTVVLPCPVITSCNIKQNDTTICVGNNVLLSDTAIGVPLATYQWSSGQNTNSILVAPTQTTVYTVTASYAGSICKDTVTVFVTQSPPTGLGNIKGTQNVCKNSDQSYAVNAINNTTSYLWTVGAGGIIQSGQGSDSVNVKWTTLGTFPITVVAKNACGNSSISTLNVIVTDTSALIIAPILGNDTICSGVASYSIPSINGATNYTWTVSNGGSITQGQGTNSITVTWTGTGQQNVSITASNSCASSNTKTKNIIVNPLPTGATINVLNDTICQGDSTIITASNSSGGIVTYNFYSASTNGVLLGVNPLKVKPTATTTYYLEVVNQYGCVNSGGRLPVTVYVNKAPSITGIGIANDSLCYGDSTVLTANINPTGAIVTWWDSLTGGNNLGTGNTLNTGGLKKTTTYYAQVVSSNGCGSLQSRTAATVYVEPINSITLISDKPNNIFADGETVTFTASPSGYSRYDFFVKNILVQTGSSATYSSSTLTDNDTVSVRATNNGCATLKAEVVVHGGDFPNAFTPNGDGKNDLYLKGYDLTILNRWGQELFAGTGGWDGSYNGQRVSPGTYFYIVKLNNKLIKGTVAVIEQ